MFTKLYVAKLFGYFVLGVLLFHLDFAPNSWQFWAFLGITIYVDLLSELAEKS